ncbi:MAG: isocitrate/isopropylmalate dehydrogenase family protein [Tissierellaceae bacterium]|nr:isocitrate/isopropylmalate dehydrogenase family protein [Tissierellaceae bacterium]
MTHNITLIYGDGIGPEVIASAVKVIEATGISINWDKVIVGEKALEDQGMLLPDYAINSIKTNKVALKGPVTTPVGGGFRSINVQLRQTLDLYANVRPIKSYPVKNCLYDDIDLVIVRENTEDLYLGIEHMVGKDAAESIKIITREASERIIRYAFDLARKENRKKVTLTHKANIMKLSDGLFLESGRKVAKEYEDIEFEDVIIDAMSMKLVQSPRNYDVIVAPNLYGDILSDMAAGLIGGLGLAPGGNIGKEIAIFEAVHGTAPDIANKNIANPTSAILSGIMLLRYIDEVEGAEKIEKALTKTLKSHGTMDLGGSLSTDEFTDEILKEMAF